MKCRKCNSEDIVKNGFMDGAQRYKCKNCSFQFTKEVPHGKSAQDKIIALVLHLSGLSMNMTGKIVGVSVQTILRWMRLFCRQFEENMQPGSLIEEIEADELAAFIGKKKTLSGSGKLLIVTLESSSGGTVLIVAPKP